MLKGKKSNSLPFNRAHKKLIQFLGLKEIEKECNDLKINFHLLRGESKIRVPELVEKLNLDAVVTDFSPLRVPLSWVEHVKKALPKDVPFCQVFQFDSCRLQVN